jgi:hypothetical protein
MPIASMLPLFAFEEWWQALTDAQQVFWVVAVFFSVLFVILFGLSLLGLGTDSDADIEVDIDADVDVDVEIDLDHDTGHDYSLDKEFSAFSIRSVIAFFTFFGWTGVYLLSHGYSVSMSVFVSLLSGGAAMFVVAYMIFQFARMEKSGTVNVFNALEHTGEVYLSIPEQPGGRGKVHIVVDGTLHEFDAETNGLSLPTGSQVKVIDVLDDQVLLVEPMKRLEG